MKFLSSLALAALLPCAAGGAISPASAPAASPLTGSAADTAGNAQIRFTYENPELQPAKYVVVADENGSGHYASELGGGPAAGAGQADQASQASQANQANQGQLPTVPQDREIQISQATREAIFSAARKSKFFTIPCEAEGAHIAFQGKKTLEYRGPDGHGGCTYNWSQDKQIEYLTDTFEAISFTLEEGAKLQVEYQHSRLLLDPELELLEEQAREGHALELENIAPILTKVAGDDAILKRAQRSARELLARAEAK